LHNSVRQRGADIVKRGQEVTGLLMFRLWNLLHTSRRILTTSSAQWKRRSIPTKLNLTPRRCLGNHLAMPIAPHFTDPEYWHKQAEEARVLAEELSGELTKAMMLRVAEDCDKLAHMPVHLVGTTNGSIPRWIEVRPDAEPR